MKLTEKVVIITGAGQGVGRAAALHFAEEGAQVVVNDIQAPLAEETVRLVTAQGGQAIAVAADITQEADVARLVETTHAHFGRLNVLYNNAGLFLEADGALPSLAAWEQTLKVNLTGTYLCCKAAIPLLVQAGAGAIINTGSFVALHGVTLPQDAYAVSKGALFTLTRALAVQYGRHNIRVNCLAPGPIRTALFEQSGGNSALRLDRIPLRRLGLPEEVARTAAFLASDEASLITGVILSVDGGLAAQTIHHNSGPEY